MPDKDGVHVEYTAIIESSVWLKGEGISSAARTNYYFSTLFYCEIRTIDLISMHEDSRSRQSTNFIIFDESSGRSNLHFNIFLEGFLTFCTEDEDVHMLIFSFTEYVAVALLQANQLTIFLHCGHLFNTLL